jgi:hypothetical protein
MLDRTIAALLLCMELARMPMKGKSEAACRTASKSPANRRNAISIANPMAPFKAMANNMDRGTTMLLSSTSSAIWTDQSAMERVNRVKNSHVDSAIGA